MTGELEQLGHYIGGRRVAGASGRTAPVFNPALGVATTQVALASAIETRSVIATARAALPEWSDTPALRRARVLFRFRDLIDKHSEEIAGILTREHGKVLADARGEVTRGLEIVEFACGIPQLLKGEYSDAVGRGIDSWSLRQPVGVCAGITPFNFPAMVPMWMFPIAIACGNTFVLKPSEKDPGCPLRLAELLTEAGAPPGVLNVVNGDREAVDTLLTDPGVDAISFVGSTPVAEHVFRTGSNHGKRVQALGGAKNHMVVMPDADPAGAAHALAGAAYGSAGERCMAISVAVAVGNAGDRLVEALRTELAAIRVLPGTAEGADMGPLVTREHLDRVLGYVATGVQEGAKLVVDGRKMSVAGHERGFFMGP
ncbi:MAG: methylmalonate-semialdehyde dehydrogenase (acylating), partial [Steroidobacteraceae bacterium]|nr:methylmalonate-semialdehyde dehydrogenase (acylating) [Steroidobacteraceae bacterium]